eukprot:584073-Hanusia_phi.AAC.1
MRASMTEMGFSEEEIEWAIQQANLQNSKQEKLPADNAPALVQSSSPPKSEVASSLEKSPDDCNAMTISQEKEDNNGQGSLNQTQQTSAAPVSCIRKAGCKCADCLSMAGITLT